MHVSNDLVSSMTAHYVFWEPEFRKGAHILTTLDVPTEKAGEKAKLYDGEVWRFESPIQDSCDPTKLFWFEIQYKGKVDKPAIEVEEFTAHTTQEAQDMMESVPHTRASS